MEGTPSLTRLDTSCGAQPLPPFPKHARLVLISISITSTISISVSVSCHPVCQQAAPVQARHARKPAWGAAGGGRVPPPHHPCATHALPERLPPRCQLACCSWELPLRRQQQEYFSTTMSRQGHSDKNSRGQRCRVTGCTGSARHKRGRSIQVSIICELEQGEGLNLMRTTLKVKPKHTREFCAYVLAPRCVVMAPEAAASVLSVVVVMAIGQISTAWIGESTGGSL